jgi:hypothetical protein
MWDVTYKKYATLGWRMYYKGEYVAALLRRGKHDWMVVVPEVETADGFGSRRLATEYVLEHVMPWGFYRMKGMRTGEDGVASYAEYSEDGKTWHRDRRETDEYFRQVSVDVPMTLWKGKQSE